MEEKQVDVTENEVVFQTIPVLEGLLFGCGAGLGLYSIDLHGHAMQPVGLCFEEQISTCLEKLDAIFCQVSYGHNEGVSRVSQLVLTRRSIVKNAGTGDHVAECYLLWTVTVEEEE